MEKYTYLIINLSSISIPLLYSFHPKLQFNKEWKSFWPAAFLTAGIFILWDILFAEKGIWGFNEQYITGINIVNLPLEEWLFFICIPYACVFTYHCLKVLIPKNPLNRIHGSITIGLATILLITGILNIDKWYTATTFIATGAFLLLHRYVLRSSYMDSFYISYTVILIPFFITNGILTGSFIEQEVVWYNDAENLSIRIFTIPVEDTFYGMLLILLNVSVFEWLKEKSGRARMDEYSQMRKSQEGRYRNYRQG